MTIILLSVAILEGMFVKKKLKSNEKMVATQEDGENNWQASPTELGCIERMKWYVFISWNKHVKVVWYIYVTA